MKFLRTFIVLSVALAAIPVLAGDEMKKLDFLVGEWKGEGWYQIGSGKREYALQSEKITAKAGGNALMIEGLGHRKNEDGSAGAVVHDAFAMLRWDDLAKQYRFSTAVAGRGTSEPEFAVVGTNKAIWSMKVPQGTMRYTISLTEKGEWLEIGEFSRDGEKWSKFFEMTLQKVK